MFLETQRLLLRKIEEADFEDYCAYNLSDPERDRMMGRDPLRTVEDVRANFNWLKDKEERAYVLVLKETDGISRQYQRQGLMEEAVRAVIAHLFQEENADYINCGCFDFNLPSLALQRKLGFTHLTTVQFETDGETFTGIENILWRT